MQTSSGVHPAS